MPRLRTLAVAAAAAATLIVARPAAAQFGTRTATGCNTYFCIVVEREIGRRVYGPGEEDVEYWYSTRAQLTLTPFGQERGVNDIWVRLYGSVHDFTEFYAAPPYGMTYEESFYDSMQPVFVYSLQGWAARTEVGSDGQEQYVWMEDVRHALTVTPEPATVALVAGGLAVLGLVARRRAT